MSRRESAATGPPGRHASARLQSALGPPPRGLLAGPSAEAFEFRSPEADADLLGAAGICAEGAVGPRTRWRLSVRLALLVAAFAVAGGAWFWWQVATGAPQVLPLAATSGHPGSDGSGPGAGQDSGSASEPPETSPSASASTAAGEVLVHVVGGVVRPGVVRLAPGSRVADALAAAGGAQAGADADRLNLAAVVVDGQKIRVPLVGEELPTGAEGGDPLAGASPQDAADGSGASAAAGSLGSSGLPMAKVNLNTASVEQLATLPRVGPVLAQRIVAWRKEHGAFKNPAELDAVDGVGPKMLETLLPLVTV
ncbi:ComEA family DNA-binding protein [Arthrobacter ulcerisalmonis]